MKVCLLCNQKWDDMYSFCPKDGGPLKEYILNTSADPLIGKWINGEYQILSKIAEGGMGDVYKAEHVGLGVVALKILHSDRMEDLDFAKRFKREEKYTGVLKHPNIVKVYELNELEDGRLFIAMEYLKGEDLDTVLEREGALSAARTIHITKEVASALAEAHRLNIIHRDIKPSNIIIEKRDDGPEKVTLLDFGIAKKVDASTASQKLTKAGMILGTFEYSSPEQLGMLKRDEKIDGRSDVYSLGIVMYEMLTGQVPFKYDNLMDIFEAHKTEKPLKPSLLRPDLYIPPKLENIILKALDKDRKKRQQSMDELIAELSAAQNDLPGAAYRGPSPSKTRPVESVVAPSKQDTLTIGTPSKKFGEGRDEPTDSESDATIVVDRSDRREFDWVKRDAQEPHTEETIIVDRDPESTIVARPRRYPSDVSGEETYFRAERGEVDKKGSKTRHVVMAIAGVVLALCVLIAVSYYLIRERTRPKVGTITISSIPTKASVFINKEWKGITEPDLIIKDLSPGTYTVKVLLDGYEEDGTDAVVKAGENLPLHFQLKRKPPEVSTSPDPKQQEIQRLLEQANLAYNQKRYLSPADDNALTHCQAILALDPNNQDALKIMDNMKQTLLMDARQAMSANRYNEAKGILQRVLGIDANNSEAKGLLNELSKVYQKRTVEREVFDLKSKLDLAISHKKFFPPDRENAIGIIDRIASLDKEHKLEPERDRVRREALNQANELLDAGNFAAASKLHAQMLEYFRNDKEVIAFGERWQKRKSEAEASAGAFERAKRRERYDSLIGNAKQLAADKKYEAASSTLQSAEKSYSDLFNSDAEARKLSKEIADKLDKQRELSGTISYNVVHLHFGGGQCKGQITVSGQGIKYHGSKSGHSFERKLDELDELRFKNGKLHFRIPGRPYDFKSKEGDGKTEEIFKKIERFKELRKTL